MKSSTWNRFAPDREVGAVAGDDKALEVADGIAGRVQGLGHKAGDVFADRIFLRVQLDGGDAVAQVYQRCAGIAFDDAVGFAKVGDGGDAGRVEYGNVLAALGVEDLLAGGSSRYQLEAPDRRSVSALGMGGSPSWRMRSTVAATPTASHISKGPSSQLKPVRMARSMLAGSAAISGRQLAA